MESFPVQLPVELVLHVLLHVDEQDLLLLRSIARVFHSSLTRLAFRTVHMRCSASDGEKRIASLLGQHAALVGYVDTLRIAFDETTKNNQLRAHVEELLPSLSALPRLRTLELCLASSRSLSPCLPGELILVARDLRRATPGSLDALRVTDATCAGLSATFKGEESELVLCRGRVASPARLPRWAAGPYQPSGLYTSVALQHAVLDAAALRALASTSRTLRRLALDGCVIDLAADTGPAVRWRFLWESVREIDGPLAALDVRSCGYGRAEQPGGAVLPAEPSRGLELLMKDDAKALRKLEEHLAARDARASQ